MNPSAWVPLVTAIGGVVTAVTALITAVTAHGRISAMTPPGPAAGDSSASARSSQP